MDFFDSLKGLFNFTKPEEGIEEVYIIREQAKKKFAFQLQKQLFMTEDEIAEILDIIKDHEKKIDEIKKNFDYNNFSILKQNQFELELRTIEKDMCQIIKETIKVIMREKAETAKDYFNKHPEI